MPVEPSATRSEVAALFAAVPPPPLSAAVRAHADDLFQRLPDADGAALVGGTLGEHTLTAVLGRGGQATVYLAEDDQGRRFALKVPHHTLIARLVREAQILFHLDHPHVVRVERAEVKGEVPYVITEYLPRGSLADRLRDRGPLAPDEVLALAGQILDALDYAHGKGVVHRDLKPSNVLFSADGQVKVADFGIGSLDLTRGRQVAQTLVSSDRTVFAGTPLYMAPEQARTAEVDARADLYALGKLLYEALTGLAPRTIKPVSRLVPGLNPAWDDYLFRLLEERPEDRFASAADACRSLPSRRWDPRPAPAPQPALPPERSRAGPRLGEALGDWYVVAPLDHDAGLSRYLVRSSAEERDALLEVCTDALAPARLSRAERVVLEAHARRVGLVPLDLDATAIAPEAAELLPEAFARAHRCCPVRRDGGALTVALADLVREGAVLEDIRLMLNLAVEPQLAAPDAIERGLNRAYGGDAASSRGTAEMRRAARFLREAEWLASLPAHPRLMAVLAYGEHAPSRRPYRILSQGPGDSLAELVPGRPFPPADALRIVRGVAEALGVLHGAGGLHNNLTPAAITIGPDGEVRVGGGGMTDPLGALGSKTSLTLAETGALLGTPLYMAPELGRVGELDARADLYSLGVVFYTLLTGAHPLERFSPLEIVSGRAHGQIAPPETHVPDLPAGYRRILGKLLATDRDARYAHAQALLDDLERMARGRAPRAPEPELWPASPAAGVWSKLAQAVLPRRPEGTPARLPAHEVPGRGPDVGEPGLAASIRLRLAPQAAPHTGRIEVSGQTVPCAVLAGDFFDVSAPSNAGDVHMAIGDASGQGLGSGLLAHTARTTLRALATAGLRPREILTEANRLLYADTRRDMFVSALVLRWSEGTDTLTWSGAGHEHLILYRARTGQAEAIKTGGCVLAAVREAGHLYQDAELRLEPGDAVMLYTDGVTEGRDSQGEFFAGESLQPLLRLVGRHGHRSAPDLIAAVHRELKQFRAGAEPTDDVTIFAIKRRADGETLGAVDG